MYALAIRLDIPDLARLAIQNFKERLEEYEEWPYYNFTEVVATVSQETQPDSALWCCSF